jgi:hypothetical protein
VQQELKQQMQHQLELVQQRLVRQERHQLELPQQLVRGKLQQLGE